MDLEIFCTTCRAVVTMEIPAQIFGRWFFGDRAAAVNVSCPNCETKLNVRFQEDDQPATEVLDASE